MLLEFNCQKWPTRQSLYPSGAQHEQKQNITFSSSRGPFWKVLQYQSGKQRFKWGESVTLKCPWVCVSVNGCRSVALSWPCILPRLSPGPPPATAKSWSWVQRDWKPLLHCVLQEKSCGGPIREQTRSESATRRTAATGKSCATAPPPWCIWRSTMKQCRKVLLLFFFLFFLQPVCSAEITLPKTFCGWDVLLLLLPRGACFLWEHLLVFLRAPPMISLRVCFRDPRHQSVQSQQWRLLPAVSAHLPDHQSLHVHGWIQPAHRAAVMWGWETRKHTQRPQSGSSYFMSNMNHSFEVENCCVLLQVSVLSCSTLCTKA